MTEPRTSLPSVGEPPSEGTEVRGPSHPTPRRWSTALLLAAVLLLGWALRLYRIDAQSFWGDELITLAESVGRYWDNDNEWVRDQWLRPPPAPTSLDGAKPLMQAVRALKSQLHPPLYYVLLRGWRELFGPSARSARILSALFSTAAVGFVFLSGTLLWGQPGGLWAALLTALAGPQITAAQDVRSYALLMLMGGGALWALLRLERSDRPRRDAVVLGGFSLGMALTHYFSLGALLALGLYALLRLRGARLTAALAAFGAAALVFLLLWAPTLAQQLHAVGMGDFLRTEEPHHAARTLARLAAVPVQSLMVLGSPMQAVILPGDVAVGALIFLLPPLLLRRRKGLLLPWLWLVGSAAFVAGLDLTRSTLQLSYVRYTLVAGVGVYLLLPGLLGQNRLGRLALPVLAAWVGLATIRDGYRPWKNEFHDYRDLAGWVDAHVPDDGLLVFQTVPAEMLGPEGEEGGSVRHRLSAISHYAYAPGRSTLVLDRPVPPATLQPLAEAGRYWVVTAPHREPDPTWLPVGRVAEKASFPVVADIYEVVLGEGAPTTANAPASTPPPPQGGKGEP